MFVWKHKSCIVSSANSSSLPFILCVLSMSKSCSERWVLISDLWHHKKSNENQDGKICRDDSWFTFWSVLHRNFPRVGNKWMWEEKTNYWLFGKCMVVSWKNNQRWQLRIQDAKLMQILKFKYLRRIENVRQKSEVALESRRLPSNR